MAIYNLIGGTASRLSIILHGGYGDIVTLTNTRNGQKYENISLEGTTFIENFEIKSGIYKVESKFLTEVGLTLPEIEIKRGISEVFVFPQNTIYWFGNGHKKDSYLLNKYGQYKTTGWKVHPNNAGKEYTRFEDDNVYTWSASDSSSTYSVLTSGEQKINLKGFTKAKFFGSKKWRSYLIDVNKYGGEWGNFGFTSETSRTSFAVKDTITQKIEKNIIEVDISDLEIGHCAFQAEAGQNNNTENRTTMYACWLE